MLWNKTECRKPCNFAIGCITNSFTILYAINLEV